MLDSSSKIVLKKRAVGGFTGSTTTLEYRTIYLGLRNISEFHDKALVLYPEKKV